MRQRGAPVVIAVDRVSKFNALHSGKHNEKVRLRAFDVLALDGDDYLDALPRLRPLPDGSRGPD
jgi:ATP-dependent DNA ligase